MTSVAAQNLPHHGLACRRVELCASWKPSGDVTRVSHLDTLWPEFAAAAAHPSQRIAVSTGLCEPS
jgi:hypothetical protein